jgi:hypothetical protein
MGQIVKLQSIVCSSLVSLALAGSAAAQTTQFDINGELRVRNENDNRDFNSDTDTKSFNVMRTRIGIAVRPANDMNVFVQVQDSRVHGQASVPASDPSVQEDGKLDLHQGFFQVQNLGWQGFGIQAGRMEVRFGNQRLIGVDDWANVNRSFDGVMAHVNRERFNAQLLWANLNENDNTIIGDPSAENNADATMQAVIGTIGVTPNLNTDLFVINARDKQTVSEDDDARLTTFGARVHGKAAQRFDYSVEGSLQVGVIETGPTTENDVSANMFGAEVGMTVGPEERPVRFGVGFDRLSGDDNVVDTEEKAFSTLFGDNHTFYGLADIVEPSLAGLQDIKFNAAATVWSDANNVFKLGGEFHNFRLVEVATGAENALGNEIDVHASWAYRERFVPTVGLSAFIPGDAVPGPAPMVEADNSYWFYAQGTVSF